MKKPAYGSIAKQYQIIITYEKLPQDTTQYYALYFRQTQHV
jgi:hypothetical protein